MKFAPLVGFVAPVMLVLDVHVNCLVLAIAALPVAMGVSIMWAAAESIAVSGER